MASLSTCHLGFWLGWQILLNLVKSNQVWTWTTSVTPTCMLSCLYVIMPNQVWTWTTSVIPTCMLSYQTKCGPGQQVSPLLVCYHACMLLCQTKCGPGQQVSSLLVCYHTKPSVDLDNKCHPYLYVIMPNQVWTWTTSVTPTCMLSRLYVIMPNQVWTWTTSVIPTCMLSYQTKCGPGQQVSPLLVCYHAKPSVDLDNKCHPYLYVIIPNQVWTWTTSVTPTCMLSYQTKCGPGQQVSPLLVCYHTKPSVDLDNK